MRLAAKYVPTDMDWHPSFIGGYVMVVLVEYHDNHGYQVHITGGDDTHIGQEFGLDCFEQALALYDSVKYIQSNQDLKIFITGPRPNNNGWPSERPKFTGSYLSDTKIEGEDIGLCSNCPMESLMRDT